MEDVSAPVGALLDRLTRLVEDARAMPMSASCVVNRREVLDLLEQVRRALPEALSRASDLVDSREQVLAEGRAEAERIVEAAKAERTSMLSRSEVHRAAVEDARRTVEEAESQAEQMRLEVEEYVDSKLANFEVVLSKTLAAVQRGRARLHGESELDELSGQPADGADGERGADRPGA